MQVLTTASAPLSPQVRDLEGGVVRREGRDGGRQGTSSQADQGSVLIGLMVIVGVILSVCLLGGASDLRPSSPRSHQWTPPHSRGGVASTSDYKDLMTLLRGRPRVGQSVRIVGGAIRKGETGTLIEDDGSFIVPFKVRFPDSATRWFSAADVALAGDLPAPHFAVGTSVGCTSVGSLGFGSVGCTVAALHADGSVDISIPGVGIYPRVARSAVRLLDGAPVPAFAPRFKLNDRVEWECRNEGKMWLPSLAVCI